MNRKRERSDHLPRGCTDCSADSVPAQKCLKSVELLYAGWGNVPFPHE